MTSSKDMSDAVFSQLLDTILTHNPKADVTLIKKAYSMAKKAHSGLTRRSGEAYILHPLSVARILAENDFVDSHIICAAILHDSIEDTPITQKDIADKLNEDVATMVVALTKIRNKHLSKQEQVVENLRKLILACAKDSRVLLIKLADRIHNMQSLEVFRPEKQERIAKNTMAVFVPLAAKVGLYDSKSKLEDLAFKYLNKRIYTYIQNRIALSQEEREQKTKEFTQTIKSLFEKTGIPYSIFGRAKNIYAIYQKMEKKNKDLSQIYDLYGIRIICQTKEDCYALLDTLENKWNLTRLKDFIKSPKPNGYQSLHANFDVEDKLVEIQIRTKDMDYQAEGGAAVHWKYKGTERDKKFEQKIGFLRQFNMWLKRNRDNKSVKNITFDIFKDEIICITPKGDTVILPEGSTAIDFAYSIHSSLGDRIKSVMVNDKVATFDQKLQSGDIVSIEKSGSPTVNSSWIQFAKKNETVQKIRKSLNMPSEQTSKGARMKKEKDVALSSVYKNLTQFKSLVKKANIKISKCCNPKPEEAIVAFYTKDKKIISVHKFDCPHQHALDPKNQVHVKTKGKKEHSHHTIHILAEPVPGILVELLNCLLTHNIQLTKITSQETKNNISFSVTYVAKTLKKDNTIKTIICDIPGVVSINQRA
ncbi:MAG: guanosine-3',5'-bis(diphosphate) 3'-pyrophosphohydrolase [Candidatus Woesearchaeota archaeon]|jgi:guanosine-3',5'-bis(diphosphate) 3'-pyrophosphohydrolase